MHAQRANLTMSVLEFTRVVATTPEDELIRDWPTRSEPGSIWSGYEDSRREVVFNAYQRLRDLATEVEMRRPAPSEAQRILAQHQLAYRDLTGVLAGIGDGEFDLSPAEGEWPLRTVLHHIALTERGFHALIHWAVSRRRGGAVKSIVMPDDYRDVVSETVDPAGTMSEVLGRYDALHSRVLKDFASLDAADLESPNVWWEGYEVPVRFRLHRFDAHLREHTIQVDKTLVGIGHHPSESERLARLVQRALSQVEGALLGASDTASAMQQSTAMAFDAMTRALG